MPRHALRSVSTSIAAALSLTVVMTAAAQDAPAAKPLDELAFLVGEWEGEAWIQMGPDRRETVRQREKVERMVNGEVLLIQGTGSQSGAEGERVVHEALAAIAWDPAGKAFSMWAYAAGRGVLQPQVEVAAGRLTWSFDLPGGRRVRYTARLDEQGRWTETGETSTDGQTWQPFMGMTLSRR